MGLHVVQLRSLVYVVCVLWWAVDLAWPLPVTAGINPAPDPDQEGSSQQETDKWADT